jgi:acyl-CoA synthetase (AMP-forming)/AMP-acid ligase II
MNLEALLKNLKIRLKAASKAFINPVSAPKQTVLIKTVDPGVVLDNQLLAGKNVLITGAARNIGRSIALEMAKQGANVFCTDIDEQGCRKLEEELKQHVGHEVGPIAKPEQVEIVDSLPKTRSGKIMRRVLKAKALGLDPGNLSTLEE